MNHATYIPVTTSDLQGVLFVREDLLELIRKNCKSQKVTYTIHLGGITYEK